MNFNSIELSIMIIRENYTRPMSGRTVRRILILTANVVRP